jgi:predicted outer membrane repeat protein
MNQAGKLGGAIYAGPPDDRVVEVGTGTEVEIHDSTFQTNEADEGGAIYAGPGTNIKIHSSTFLTNQAESAGGAIFAGGGSGEQYRGGNITISFSDFTANNAGGEVSIL